MKVIKTLFSVLPLSQLNWIAGVKSLQFKMMTSSTDIKRGYLQHTLSCDLEKPSALFFLLYNPSFTRLLNIDQRDQRLTGKQVRGG